MWPPSLCHLYTPLSKGIINVSFWYVKEICKFHVLTSNRKLRMLRCFKLWALECKAFLLNLRSECQNSVKKIPNQFDAPSLLPVVSLEISHDFANTSKRLLSKMWWSQHKEVKKSVKKCLSFYSYYASDDERFKKNISKKRS